MKIIVKRKEWHRKIGGNLNENETTHEFENVDTDCKWTDWGAAYEPNSEKIKGAPEREINFSFKVNEINNDNIVFEIGGNAGLYLKELNEDENQTKVIVLHLGEEKGYTIYKVL